MRALLIEMQQIEAFLFQRSSDAEREAMELRMLVTPSFQELVCDQQSTYELIGKYGRNELCKELDLVTAGLFETGAYESFKTNIYNIFT